MTTDLDLAMGEMGYEDSVHKLIADGWVLRCGHCSRRLNTDHAPTMHRVFADLSGRCYAEITPGATYVSTRFFADPYESAPDSTDDERTNASLRAKDRLIESLQQHLDWYKERYPCTGCADAPEEDCPRHGRSPSDLWTAISLLQRRLGTAYPNPCPDCSGGMVDGAQCATCEPSPSFHFTVVGDRARLVPASLPGIANEEAFAIYLTREDTERITVALLLDQFGADRTGDV